jgi:hypothetical protein
MDTIQPGVTGRRTTSENGPLLPARAVWEYFGICDRTLDRWLESPQLNFPQPIVINKRRYWFLSKIEDFARALKGAA